MLKKPHNYEGGKASTTSGRNWGMIQPSLLLDGKRKDNSSVWVGIECLDNKINTISVTYLIDGEDVAFWIFNENVEGSGEERDGEIVTLTFRDFPCAEGSWYCIYVYNNSFQFVACRWKMESFAPFPLFLKI